MRYKIIYTLIVSTFFLFTNAQKDDILITKTYFQNNTTKSILNNNYFQVYKDTLLKELNSYSLDSGKAVHYDVLDSNILKIFSTVALNGSDLSTSGSSLGYTLKDDKTSLAINGVFKVGKSNKHFGQLGLNLEASGTPNFFAIYSDKSWNTSTSLNANYIYTFKSSQFFNDKAKEKLQDKRGSYFDSLVIYEYNLIQLDLDSLDKDIKILESIVNLQKSGSDKEALASKIILIKHLAPDITHPKAFNILQKLKKRQKEHLELISSINSKLKIKKKINKDLYTFDLKNDILNGYFVKWLSFPTNYSFTQYNLKDSILTDSILELNNIEKIETNFKFSFGANYNINYKQKHFSFFTTAGLNVKTGSYIDNEALKLDEPIVVLESNEILVKNEEKTIGTYKSLKDNQWFMGVNAYGAFFYKSFGFNAQFNHNFALNEIKGNEFRNNFTFLFGPIFKVSGESEWSKAVFGLDLGFQNMKYGDKLNENFLAKLKVGVPFTVFSKEKKKKEE